MIPKNILLVISKFPPEYSGPGVRIPRLYKWFKGKGYDFNLQVLCNGIEQNQSAIYKHEGLSVRRIAAQGLKFLPKLIQHRIHYQIEFIKTLWALNFSKEYKNVDFLHVAGHSGGTAAALIWAKSKKIPVLMELVTEHARHVQKYFFVFKARVPENGIVIALTEKARASCIALGLDEKKIWCRPNPIDSKKFVPSFFERQKLRRDLTLFNENHIVISNVAKIMPQKNQFLILKALTHLPKKFVTVIAGPFIQEGLLYDRDKKYFEGMNAFIKENNLLKRVQLIPDFVQADQYMKLANIYAMPAWNEGFGTPMMEAMGCGLPVIANQGEAAFQEWIVDGENGFLCDIEDPEQWAQAIEKATEFSKEQCLDISSNIHEKAGQEAIYNHYEAVITKLIQD